MRPQIAHGSGTLYGLTISLVLFSVIILSGSRIFAQPKSTLGVMQSSYPIHIDFKKMLAPKSTTTARGRGMEERP